MRAVVAALLALALAAGCTRLPDPPDYFKQKGVTPPTLERFTVCHGYDCTFRTAIELKPEEWAAIRALFQPPPADAAAERRAVGAAIALFERQIGARIGTSADTPGLAFIAAGNPTQQDCIDESTDTTVYLTLLQMAGLLHWHEVAAVASRGFFLDIRWYHQTAVMRERATGVDWAVDSWFNANGVPPIVTPLDHWASSYGRPSGT